MGKDEPRRDLRSLKATKLTLRALLLLSREVSEVGRTEMVPIEQIVAEPWDKVRMDRARKLLAKGQSPPPITVVRYLVHGQAIYQVSDGNHRVAAAREADHRHILAKITDACICRPDRCLIRRSVLYRMNEQGHPTSWEELYGCDDLLGEFRRLGVPDIPTGEIA